jgi:putative membrane protein
MHTLSPTELSVIEAAVKEAEARTTGEIYCVVAEESSDYGETPLAWAGGVALLAPAILLIAGVHVSIPDFFSTWSAAQVGEAIETSVRNALIGTIVLQGILFAATALIVAIPTVRRALTPRGLKRDRVRQRAEEQFLAKNLSATRDRTGVLIYVSAAERMAELLADQGIHEQVGEGVWKSAMASLTDGLRRGEAAAGFVDAIAQCAQVLASHFPARAGDNPNELPDAVVVLTRS